MSFHQAVCEIVDDAIAASKGQALVCIAFAADEDKNYLHMAIADWGCGMDINGLTNALQLGSLPAGDNRLNAHGFGRTTPSHVSRMKPERGASTRVGTRATISRSAVHSIRA